MRYQRRQYIATAEADRDLEALTAHLKQTIPGFKVNKSSALRWAVGFAVRQLNVPTGDE